jgi:hypothetical protein
VSRLKFEQILNTDHEVRFTGAQVAGLYVLLLRDEESLDQHQRGALECLRSILYEDLSIEDMECVQTLYASATASQMSS